MDTRIEKTKTRLHDALLELLQTHSLGDITVSALCAKAGVNRTTFYVHYDNVTDCFEEITDAIVADMRKAVFQEPERDTVHFLHVYFQTARKNQTVFRAIHSTNIHDPMIRKMVDLCNDSMGSTMAVPKGDENLTFTYIFSGFYGFVEAWLRNGCQETDEELLETMGRFFPEQLQKSLQGEIKRMKKA